MRRIASMIKKIRLTSLKNIIINLRETILIMRELSTIPIVLKNFKLSMLQLKEGVIQEQPESVMIHNL